MHVHILGIAGTFMSALAILAKAKGYRVTGNDAACYPPISDLLIAHGIDFIEGYDDINMALSADLVLVGNAMKRGMPCIERLLNKHKRYFSGPEWLASEILKDYRVLAVSGTHGKTSTATMLAFILTEAGLKPSYLLGGVPQCLAANAKLDSGEWFVIEADEYDTAFFDKRPKFMHYRPEGLILHHLEFDHADIYPSLDAILQQFHYLFRSIPQTGWIVRPMNDEAVDSAFEKGVYSPATMWGSNHAADVQVELMAADGSAFRLTSMCESALVEWDVLGQHNVENAAAAMIAASKIGVGFAASAAILKNYTPVKRRMEICFQHTSLTVYDDFAHHPTAISKTTQAIKASNKHQRLLGILDFASNSMRSGHHLQAMPAALTALDGLYLLNNTDFNLKEQAEKWPCTVNIFSSVETLLAAIMTDLMPGDAVIMMSNKGFAMLKQRFLDLLAEAYCATV